jgi:hypothetical protein
MVRNNAKAAKASSELRVITKTRDLSKALFLTTATTPKRFRFSLCDRIESNAIEALTHMIWANDTRLDIKDPKSPRIRRRHQHEAERHLRNIDSLIGIGVSVEAFSHQELRDLGHQLRNIRNLLRAWQKSDAQRIAAIRAQARGQR